MSDSRRCRFCGRETTHRGRCPSEPRRWWLPAGFLLGMVVWAVSELWERGLDPLPPLLSVGLAGGAIWLAGDILTTPSAVYDEARHRDDAEGA